jgi:preprotein translocase SecE subunit
VVVIGGIFAFLWYKGFLVRMANYAGETREELRKCSWPSVEELRGSTAVIVVTVAMLALFIAFVDLILSAVVKWLSAL